MTTFPRRIRPGDGCCSGCRYDRLRSGLNHIALWAGERADLDELVIDAAHHGWTLLFADEHPHAGGPDHYAAYLEDDAGFEVELVAEGPRKYC